MRRSFTKLALQAPAMLLVGTSLFLIAQTASAQYSTDFNSGYAYNQNLSGQAGWTTNDDSTGATYMGADIGNSDSVGVVSGFSQPGGDRAAVLGGIFAPPGVAFPGSSQVYLGHSINLGNAAALTFNVDFTVNASQSPNSAHDNFGFSFQNGDTVPASLFSINFVVPNDGSNDFDNVRYTSGNLIGTAATAFQLGLRYHLTVNVNVTANTFSASYFRELASGVSAGEGTFDIATNVGYSGNIAAIAATWSLASLTTAPADGGTTTGTNNTAYTNPGSNALIFDNFAATVPEPSTYALLGMGAFGLAAAMRARRTQRA